MKNLFLSIIMLCGFVLFSSNSLQAQDRLAYVDSETLVSSMPAYKAAEKQLADYTAQKEALIKQKYEALQRDAATLQQRVESLTITQQEVQTEQQRLVQEEQIIQQAAVNAEIEIRQKQQSLLTPIQEKAMAAIKTVADELGYNYVIDVSTGGLLYYPPGSDITEQVKARLM